MSSNNLQKYYKLVNQLYDVIHGGFAAQHPLQPDPQCPLAVQMQKKSTTLPSAGNKASQSAPILRGPVYSSLAELLIGVKDCQSCRLCHTRTNVVGGQGVENPQVLVIGEGPGANEDLQGLPFVGKGGQYLDKWLASIDLDRKTNCYIANIVKCRPPQNRDPMKDEIEACVDYLQQQIVFLKPKVILACGRIAGQTLCGRQSALTTLRQRVHSYENIPLVITYHPAAVLRNPDLRRPVWEDLKFLKKLLEEMVET